MPIAGFVPLEGKSLENLDNTAAYILEGVRRDLGPGTSYGPQAVKLISDDIDRNRARYNADENLRKQVLWRYGAFLGKAIIESAAPGKVIWMDNGVDNFALRLTTSKGETPMCAPFTKVIKHLSNGPEDSVYGFFLAMDDVIRNGMPTRR